MSGEFLKKARARIPQLSTVSLKEFQEGRARLAQECWPEILAVVAAADEVSFTVGRNESTDFAKLGDALEALDKKAGES